jgi:hypothetical protein
MYIAFLLTWGPLGKDSRTCIIRKALLEKMRSLDV